MCLGWWRNEVVVEEVFFPLLENDLKFLASKTRGWRVWFNYVVVTKSGPNNSVGAGSLPNCFCGTRCLAGHPEPLKWAGGNAWVLVQSSLRILLTLLIGGRRNVPADGMHRRDGQGVAFKLQKRMGSIILRVLIIVKNVEIPAVLALSFF